MIKIKFTPKPSKTFLFIYAFLSILALLIILILSLNIIYKSLILIVLLSFVLLFRYKIRSDFKSFFARCVLEDNQWYLYSHSDHQFSVKLIGNSIVTNWLILLNFKINHQWGTKSLVLMQDSLDKASFRRLKVLLLN